jgi:thiamine pyrophosphate-dependent acetolactate synthase large subunit-like protein
MGFAQMIAPVVRLQDWATVKSHVYTVYNLVGDDNDTWLRSQTTLDRKTDFPALARAFGAQGRCAETLDQLREALTDLPADGPCLIDCRVDRDEKVFPMVPPGGSVKDIMISEVIR